MSTYEYLFPYPHLAMRLQPQPRWEVLRAMNYVVVILFVSSVSYVMVNYRWAALDSGSGLTAFSSGDFVPVIVLWACCLLYFFGFFGISLVDTEELSESPSRFGLTEIPEADKPTAITATIKPFSAPVPMHDTAICAERPVVKPPAEKAVAGKLLDLNFTEMTDEEVLSHLMSGSLKDHQLEKKLGDMERAVSIRRRLYENILGRKMDLIPYTGYDYNKVFGANCEIVIGYVPLPLGVVGPLLMNGESVYVPMATTEGCLVASTNRGCKAISQSGETCLLCPYILPDLLSDLLSISPQAAAVLYSSRMLSRVRPVCASPPPRAPPR